MQRSFIPGDCPAKNQKLLGFHVVQLVCAGKGELAVMLFLSAGITHSLIASMKMHCHFLVRSVPWKNRKLQFQVLSILHILIVLRLLLNDGGTV